MIEYFDVFLDRWLDAASLTLDHLAGSLVNALISSSDEAESRICSIHLSLTMVVCEGNSWKGMSKTKPENAKEIMY